MLNKRSLYKLEIPENMCSHKPWYMVFTVELFIKTQEWKHSKWSSVHKQDSKMGWLRPIK